MRKVEDAVEMLGMNSKTTMPESKRGQDAASMKIHNLPPNFLSYTRLNWPIESEEGISRDIVQTK